MKTNKIIMLITFLILISLNLKCEDNKYDIYSKGINFILHKDKSIFDSTYLKNLCISEFNTFGGDVMADLQQEHYKKIFKFSKNLAYRFKSNTILETRIVDSLKLDFPYTFLQEEEVWEHFSIESNKHKTYDSLSDYYKNGGLINLSEIIYNKRRNKAAYFIFILSATSSGGSIYLVFSEKNNNIWYTKKGELIGWIH
ncbi:MAG: hypothetical protein KF896_14045 [Ignavibacteriae bacterium]|nr:hypothetical protein [Ignavibacteriota bacterium]